MELHSNFFTVFILIVTLVNLIVSYLIEKMIIPLITKKWEKNKINKLIQKSKDPNNELTLGELQIIDEVNKKENLFK